MILSAMATETGTESLEQTMVLDELPILTVRQAGKPARSYTLPRDQIFAVGRAPKVNTLAVEDPAISGQVRVRPARK